MVTELLIKHTCDSCGSWETGNTDVIQTYTFTIFNDNLEADLCRKCREEEIYNLTLARLVQILRPVQKVGRPRSPKGRPLKSGKVLLNREDDGYFHCPSCSHKYLSGQGMRDHLRDQHGNAGAYRVAFSPNPFPRKKAGDG